MIKKLTFIIPIISIIFFLVSCETVNDIMNEIENADEQIQKFLKMYQTMYNIIVIQFVLWIVIGAFKLEKNINRDNKREELMKQIDEVNNKLNLLMVQYVIDTDIKKNKGEKL